MTAAQKNYCTQELVQLHRRISKDFKGRQDLNKTTDQLLEMLRSSDDDDTSIDDVVQLNDELQKYEAIRQAPYQKSVDFWKQERETFPLLYNLAVIVNAIPATECRIEQNFSGFNYIYNCYRNSLKPSNVSDVLMVRLNKEVFYQQWELEKKQISTD